MPKITISTKQECLEECVAITVRMSEYTTPKPLLLQALSYFHEKGLYHSARYMFFPSHRFCYIIAMKQAKARPFANILYHLHSKIFVSNLKNFSPIPVHGQILSALHMKYADEQCQNGYHSPTLPVPIDVYYRYLPYPHHMLPHSTPPTNLRL